jgi:hypothetical protein
LAQEPRPEEERGPGQVPPTSSAELLAALLVPPALSIALRLAAPHLGFAAAFVTIPLALLTILWVIWAVVRARMHGLGLAAVLLVTAFAWLAALLPVWTGHTALGVAAVRNLALTVFGAALGVALASAVRDRNLLVPAGIFAAAIDVAVVFWGPTGRAVEKVPQVVTQLSVHTHIPGTAAPPLAPGAPPLPPEILNIGFLDVLMAAFMLAALLRFGMRSQRAFWHICFWWCVVALGAVVMAWPLPGWPFIVLGALVPNRDQFRFSRGEKVAMGAAVGFALVAVWAVLWATKRMW